jgi:hypothetical protein
MSRHYEENEMLGTFHRNMGVLQGKTYAERATECLRVAKVCPKFLKESYLQMAVEYAQLAEGQKEGKWAS